MITKYIIEIDSPEDTDTTLIKARLINSLNIFGNNIDRKTIYDYTEKDYVAVPFPDYQQFMEKDWFEEESYYDCDKDVYLIPKERYNESI